MLATQAWVALERILFDFVKNWINIAVFPNATPRANFEKHLRRNKNIKDAQVHGWGRQISDVPECGCLLELKLLLTATKTVKDAESNVEDLRQIERSKVI